MSQQRRLVFANSLDYAPLTGGFVYNTRFMRELGALGWDIAMLDLPAGFPRPDAAAREHSGLMLAGLPDGALVIADQICFSPLADVLVREGRRLRLVMIFHHPIAREEGLAPEERERFMAAERAALSCCRLVVATSGTTAETLVAEYGLARECIVVAPPGMDRPDVAPLPLGEVPQLLSVGAVIPRKGYHVLIEALGGVRDLPWRLDIVGDLERAPAYVDQLRAQIAEAGLVGRAALKGGLSVTDLDALWRSAHVYVASSSHEGYGMAVAEAIARGIPTVTTGADAIGGWLHADAALIVPESSSEALRDALVRVLSEPVLRSELRARAFAAAARFPSWSDAAAVVDARLEALLNS